MTNATLSPWGEIFRTSLSANSIFNSSPFFPQTPEVADFSLSAFCSSAAAGRAARARMAHARAANGRTFRGIICDTPLVTDAAAGGRETVRGPAGGRLIY